MSRNMDFISPSSVQATTLVGSMLLASSRKVWASSYCSNMAANTPHIIKLEETRYRQMEHPDSEKLFSSAAKAKAWSLLLLCCVFPQSVSLWLKKHNYTRERFL